MSITPDPPEVQRSARASLLGNNPFAGAGDSLDEADRIKPPPLPMILGLLAGAVALFSYLGAYAISAMLIEAQMVAAWPPEADPRPRWMAGIAAGLTLVLGAVAVLLRASTGKTMDHLGRLESQENPPVD